MVMEPPPHPGVDPPDAPAFDAFQFQFNEGIHRLIAAPTPPPPPLWNNASSSFTALLELDPSQAAKLLHPSSGNFQSKPHFSSHYLFSSKVKTEAVIESAEKSSDRPLPVASDPPVESNGRSAAKRKEREQKARGSAKKKKRNESSQDGVILPYVHVRARRGEATDSHSLAERARREKINARMKLLQELVPGCNKISGTALVLDEIINHVQSLQRQVELLLMKLAAVYPQIDFNLDNLFAPEHFSLLDSDFPMPPMWPEIQFSGSREQYQQPWHCLSFQQSALGKEEATSDVAPEISYLTYDCSTNSGSFNPHQLKMEM